MKLNFLSTGKSQETVMSVESKEKMNADHCYFDIQLINKKWKPYAMYWL